MCLGQTEGRSVSETLLTGVGVDVLLSPSHSHLNFLWLSCCPGPVNTSAHGTELLRVTQ